MKASHYLNIALVSALMFIIGIACKNSHDSTNAPSRPTLAESRKGVAGDGKLDEYTIKGFHFVYFKVLAGLRGEELIDTAQKLHDAEPGAQLLLVDDDSKVKDYIAYAKAMSEDGDLDKVEMPREWADKHIVANVQKHMNGKFVLCEGNGYAEIAELR